MKLDRQTINNTSEAIENVRTTYNPFQILRNAEEVTTSDSADLDNYGILYVTTGGTITVDLAGSGTVTYTLGDAEFLPVLVKKVYATGTSATGIYVQW